MDCNLTPNQYLTIISDKTTNRGQHGNTQRAESKHDEESSGIMQNRSRHVSDGTIQAATARNIRLAELCKTKVSASQAPSLITAPATSFQCHVVARSSFMNIAVCCGSNPRHGIVVTLAVVFLFLLLAFLTMALLPSGLFLLAIVSLLPADRYSKSSCDLRTWRGEE